MRPPLSQLCAGALLVALLCSASAQAQTAPATPAAMPGMDSPLRPGIPVDAAQRAQIIATLVKKMRDNYVFPDIAEKMAVALLVHDKRGAYNGDDSVNAFCDHLTTHLQEISHDKHIRVRF